MRPYCLAETFEVITTLGMVLKIWTLGFPYNYYQILSHALLEKVFLFKYLLTQNSSESHSPSILFWTPAAPLQPALGFMFRLHLTLSTSWATSPTLSPEKRLTSLLAKSIFFASEVLCHLSCTQIQTFCQFHHSWGLYHLELPTLAEKKVILLHRTNIWHRIICC